MWKTRRREIIFKRFINNPIRTFRFQFGSSSATVKFNRSYNNTTLKVEKLKDLHIYEYVCKKINRITFLVNYAM